MARITDDSGKIHDFTISFAKVAARRTTTLALTNDFQDVTLDTTESGVDSAILEHDSTNKERLIAHTSGSHIFCINFVFDNASNQDDTIEFELLINGAAGPPIPPTQIMKNSPLPIIRIIPFEVDAADDFYSIQVKKTGSSNITMQNQARFAIAKLGI